MESGTRRRHNAIGFPGIDPKMAGSARKPLPCRWINEEKFMAHTYPVATLPI